MSEKILIATHTGEVKIGDTVIACAVLEDGTRVLSERAVTKAFGAKRGGAHWRRKKSDLDGANLPVYASAKNIIPFINNSLESALTNLILYKVKNGKTIAHGLQAKYLPDVCDVWLKARDAGKVFPSQVHLVIQADMLMRGLATVGIIALVDEATGYQETRDRKALHDILDRFLRKELAAWAKTFPDEFYKEIFKLKGWPWNPKSVKRPSIIGKYTNDIVYERIAPGLLQELQTKNPKDEKGRRKHKNFQWLTDDIGHPALSRHIHAVIALMRGSTKWDGFHRILQRSFPKQNESIWLSLLEDE